LASDTIPLAPTFADESQVAECQDQPVPHSLASLVDESFSALTYPGVDHPGAYDALVNTYGSTGMPFPTSLAYDGNSTSSDYMAGPSGPSAFTNLVWDASMAAPSVPDRFDQPSMDETTAQLAQMLVDNPFSFWPPPMVPDCHTLAPTAHLPFLPAHQCLPASNSAPPSPFPSNFFPTEATTTIPYFGGSSPSHPYFLASATGSPTSSTAPGTPGPKRSNRPAARRRRSADQPIPSRKRMGVQSPSATPESPLTTQPLGVPSTTHPSNVSDGVPMDLSHSAPASLTTVHTFASYNAKGDIRLCANCGVIATPSWRRTKDGKILMCNACGLFYKNCGKMRSWVLSNAVVKVERSGISEWLTSLNLPSTPPPLLMMGGIGTSGGDAGSGMGNGPARLGAPGRTMLSATGDNLLVEDRPVCCCCARDSFSINLHPCAQRAYYVCTDCAKDFQRRLRSA
ncbi:hypothetical protein IWQ60_003970, partial [Tieghemiomyces parasiticus]